MRRRARTQRRLSYETDRSSPPSSKNEHAVFSMSSRFQFKAVRAHYPVLDFEPKSGATSTHSADALLSFIKEQGYTPVWILDTHPHADHFSAAGYLKDRTSARTGIGEKVVEVQRLWKDIYNLPKRFRTDGSQWDKLFADGERFEIGNLTCEVLFSPGHTLASISYVVSDAAFIHDTLFMPDGGTARCDFPGGSAKALWWTIQRLLSLPADTRLFTGHDYLPGGREPRWESTVAQQKTENIHLRKARTEDEFVSLRQSARPNPADAEAHPRCPPGQHRWREASRTGEQRHSVSKDTAGCALKFLWDE